NFAAQYTSGQVALTWSAVADDRTPLSLLTYNLHLVDANGNVWLNAETNQAGNFRRRFAPGNVGHSTSKTLNHLPAGTYTARVQALDASFALSAWSAGLQFTILEGPSSLAVERILLTRISLSWTSRQNAATGVTI